MNRNIFLVALLLTSLSFLTPSCEKDNDLSKADLLKFKEIAWNSLNDSEQKFVTVNWQDANAKVIKNPDNDTEDIVLVSFQTTVSDLTGPLNVFIHIKTEEVFQPKNLTDYAYN